MLPKSAQNSRKSACRRLQNGSCAVLLALNFDILIHKTLVSIWSFVIVNAIAPGIFHSEMADLMLERIGDVSKNLPRKRICTPEQMDSTLLFLVSPSSECVTGTCIKIDDGQSSR